MRLLNRRVLTFLFASCLATVALADDSGTQKAAELKWARGIAEDFLDATLSREPDQAEVLLGSDLKKIISPEQHSNEIRNWLADEVYNQGYRSKSLQIEEIAPDKDESQFKGILKGEKVEADFVLRLVKEKDSGKWRVNYFHIAKREETKEPAPKP